MWLTGKHSCSSGEGSDRRGAMSASSKRDMHTSSEKEAVRWVELLLELAVSEECLVEAVS